MCVGGFFLVGGGESKLSPICSVRSLRLFPVIWGAAAAAAGSDLNKVLAKEWRGEGHREQFQYTYESIHRREGGSAGGRVAVFAKCVPAMPPPPPPSPLVFLVRVCVCA